MHVSKLILNPGSYRVQKEISNPYQLHRTIMQAFPNNLNDNKSEERILFRLSTEKNTSLPIVLVQSFSPPDWNFLKNEQNYVLKEPQVKNFKYPQFMEGNSYWFRIFCNPTKRSNGKRVGMYKDEEQFEWLTRKTEVAGFRVVHASITRKEEITARVKKGAPKMTFQGVQFEGVLRVVNPELFRVCLQKGIGSRKAFGCGFLTISKF